MKLAICIASAYLILCGTSALAADIKKGDKVQLLSNLHPESDKPIVYAINYQLPSRLPVCAEVVVKDLRKDSMTFVYLDREYQFVYDKYIKGTKLPFQTVLQTYFGPACDKAKMDGLSKADQDGIRDYRPAVGMTRDGILFAMGRPPYHVNPDLNSKSWVYWRNRFVRTAIDFDDNGVVVQVR
jgi:hypothetical protein